MEKILIIDDEVNNLDVLQARLRANDFVVVTCEDPEKGMRLAETENPDLILLDLNMPRISGLDVCRKLKNDYATANIPIVLLTCMDDISYKIQGFEGGADDYMVKDQIDYREIAARIRSILRRIKSDRSANPLTGLPGNDEIIRKITSSIHTGIPFSVGYVDIDNFKPYNDRYGFSQGDHVILLIAKALRESLKQYGDNNSFLGHIGGDDFVLVGDPYKMRNIAAFSVEVVKKNAVKFYSDTEKMKGGIEGLDRHGIKRFFPFFGISVAIVDVDPMRAAVTADQIATIASRIKKELKNMGGNLFGGYELIMKHKASVTAVA